MIVTGVALPDEAVSFAIEFKDKTGEVRARMEMPMTVAALKGAAGVFDQLWVAQASLEEVNKPKTGETKT